MQGFIGIFCLEDWWTNELSASERALIERTYGPVGAPAGLLTSANISGVSLTKLAFLSTLATWFQKQETYRIAKKILAQAQRAAEETDDLIDLHYYYQNRIQIFYRNRETDRKALGLAIKACEDQIAIAADVAAAFRVEHPDGPLFEHVGYKQLCIINHKRGRHKDVVDLCTEAKQQGWAGDWDRRIEQAKRKIGSNT